MAKSEYMKARAVATLYQLGTVISIDPLPRKAIVVQGMKAIIKVLSFSWYPSVVLLEVTDTSADGMVAG